MVRVVHGMNSQWYKKSCDQLYHQGSTGKQPHSFLSLLTLVQADECGDQIYTIRPGPTSRFSRFPVGHHYPITIHFGDRDASHANGSWKLRKAYWVSFADRDSEQLGSGNPNISIDEFTEKLISIAFDTIPKSKHSVCKHNKDNKVWFNDSCKDAIKNRKKALRKVRSCPTSENIDRYKMTRAKTRKTIKGTRRQSLQNFVSSINSRTSLKKVWNMINKIAGKRSSAEVKQLQTDDKEITSVTDIADTLAETFSEIFSTPHYGETFQLHKASAERQTLKFNSNTQKHITAIFQWMNR